MMIDTIEPMHQMQMDMEKLFSKNQLFPRIRAWLEESPYDIEAAAAEASLSVDFCYDLLAQMVLHKRTTIDVLVGLLRKHFKAEANPFQACADAVETAVEFDFVDYDPTIGTGMFIVAIDIPKAVQDELDMYQFPLPMVVSPKQVTSNLGRGYLTDTSSVILKNNHHTGNVCLDHLNRMNSIPLTINSDTALMVKLKWRGLDKRKDDETFDDFKKRIKAFEKYSKTAHDVHAHLAIAGDRFYLTHAYDKRGRCYSNGYHVNYQGADWNKAVIEFADKEICE